MEKTNTCEAVSCGQQFSYEAAMFNGEEMFKPKYCRPCTDAAMREREIAEMERRQQQLEYHWTKLCPHDFSEIDKALLPVPELLPAVLKWQYGKRGVLVAGNTSKGKTRCAWQVLKREHFNGKRCAAVTPYDLQSYSARCFHDSVGAHKWLTECCRAELLLLDDPFKVKLTERAEEALFIILDERTSRELPLIVTMNGTSETVGGKMSEDRSAPIIRRIREFCEAVTL